MGSIKLKPRKSKMATTATVSTSAQSQKPQNTESLSPTQAQDGNPTGPTSHDYLTRQDIIGIVQQFANIFWNEFQRSSDSNDRQSQPCCLYWTHHQSATIHYLYSTPPVTVQVISQGAPFSQVMVGYSIS